MTKLCRGMFASVALLLALSLDPASAQTRASGIQLTPDSSRYLINKDVGAERWAITYDTEDGSLTGNVFFADGGEPQFVWCRRVADVANEDPAQARTTFECFGAPRCAQAPCASQVWQRLAEVELGGEFLLPPGTRATLSGNVQPILTTSCATSEACHSSVGGHVPRLGDDVAYQETVGVPASQDSSKSFIAPFNPDGSYLLDKVLGIASAGTEMPPDAPPLSSAQIDALRSWILEGAVRN